MSGQVIPIEIGHLPDLVRLAEEVRTSGDSRLLKCGDRDVALVAPVGPPPATSRRSKRRDRRTSDDDPLWNIIGIADSAGSPDDATDMARNKHQYLADAYDVRQ